MIQLCVCPLHCAFPRRTSQGWHHCLLTHAIAILAGVKGRRIRELTSVVQKRFKFPEGSVELYAEKVSS
jgi:ribosomal protein S3